MRFLLIAALVGSTAVAAVPKAKKGKASPAPQAEPATAEPKAEAPAGNPKAAAAAAGDARTVLAKLQSLYGALEYDQVIPLADAFLARTDLLIDQRLEAYRLQGSARAIVEDPVYAEKPFRLLLRARPDYELPGDTPPKILGVFRKVQTEEKALAAQLREVERARIVGNLKLVGEPPSEVKGGRPLPFSFRLRDQTGAVETIRVPYRRSGSKAFSSVALSRAEDGTWAGLVPAEFTADERGFTLEYYVETSDAQGPLLSLGDAALPRSVHVLPGLVEVRSVKPIPRWAFWTGVTATGVVGAAALGLRLWLFSAQAQYTALASNSPVDGRKLVAMQRRGDAVATSLNVSLVALGVVAVATGVMAPLTQFQDQ
jgi:hypothetical protein